VGFFHSILWVDGIISVGIVVGNNFKSDIIDVITVPSTFTLDTWFEWIFTVDISEVWTVFISPSVFNVHDTGVDFTLIDVSILIDVTLVHKDIHMVSVNRVSDIDVTINVGVISGNDF